MIDNDTIIIFEGIGKWGVWAKFWIGKFAWTSFSKIGISTLLYYILYLKQVEIIQHTVNN